MSNKKITVGVVAFFLVYIVYTTFKLNGVNEIGKIFTDTLALENVNYVLGIIGSIVVVLTAIIAVWQYVLTARCERNKIKNDRVEKAVHLAKYYKDNIIVKIAALRYLFKESGISEILEKIKPSEMKNFDEDELKEKLSSADIKEISKIMGSEKMITLILEADQVYCLNLDLELITDSQKSTDENNKIILRHFMSRVVNDLLNEMEYFSMNFTHKVADESVVYQSLHQTYMQAVEFLYYNISKNNRPDGRQFYTNVVELYKIWYKKDKKMRDNVANGGRKINKGNFVEDID